MDNHTTPTSDPIRAVTGCTDEFFSLERANETDVGYDVTHLTTTIVAAGQSSSQGLS